MSGSEQLCSPTCPYLGFALRLYLKQADKCQRPASVVHPLYQTFAAAAQLKLIRLCTPPPNRWITSGREKCAAFEGNEPSKPLKDHFSLYHVEYVNASWAWTSLLRGEASMKELQQKLCCFEDRILTVPHNLRLVVMAGRLIDSFKQRNFLIQRSKDRKLCSLCQF